MRPESKKPFFLGLGLGFVLGLLLCVAGLGTFAYWTWKTMEGMDVSTLAGVAVPEEGSARFAIVEDSLRLRTLDGDTLTLVPPYAQPLVLNVWATWCTPCRKEMPSLEALADSLRNQGIDFYCVSKEDPEILRAFLEKHPTTLPVYQLVGFLPDELAAPVIPSTFVLDPEGGVRLQHRGATKWDDARIVRYIRRLRAEETGRS